MRRHAVQLQPEGCRQTKLASVKRGTFRDDKSRHATSEARHFRINIRCVEERDHCLKTANPQELAQADRWRKGPPRAFGDQVSLDPDLHQSRFEKRLWVIGKHVDVMPTTLKADGEVDDLALSASRCQAVDHTEDFHAG